MESLKPSLSTKLRPEGETGMQDSRQQHESAVAKPCASDSTCKQTHKQASQQKVNQGGVTDKAQSADKTCLSKRLTKSDPFHSGRHF